jgi:hypothetical protein
MSELPVAEPVKADQLTTMILSDEPDPLVGVAIKSGTLLIFAPEELGIDVEP